MNVNANSDIPKVYNADPTQWGPHVWATLHTLALRSDSVQTVDSFHMFIESLQSLLPCDTCQNDYIKWVKQNGKPSVGNAFEWSVQLHNYVNSKLNKPQITLEAAREAWVLSNCSYSCKSKPTSSNSRMSLLLILLLTAIIGILLAIK